MIIYRPNRGSIDESMGYAKEFNSLQEMKSFIVDDWKQFGPDMLMVDDIVLGSETSNDEKTGWKDTRLVCTKRLGNKRYDIPQCIGYCASDYPKGQ